MTKFLPLLSTDTVARVSPIKVSTTTYIVQQFHATDQSSNHLPSLLSIKMGAKGLVAQGPPLLPKWIFYTKITIILLAVVVLALAAYAISIHGGYSYYYSSGVTGFLIFLVSACSHSKVRCSCSNVLM